MAQINIRIDDELKSNAEKLFNELGLNITTAVTMFLKQAERQEKIPFEIAAKADLSRSEESQENK